MTKQHEQIINKSLMFAAAVCSALCIPMAAWAMKSVVENKETIANIQGSRWTRADQEAYAQIVADHESRQWIALRDVQTELEAGRREMKAWLEARDRETKILLDAINKNLDELNNK